MAFAGFGCSKIIASASPAHSSACLDLFGDLESFFVVGIVFSQLARLRLEVICVQSADVHISIFISWSSGSPEQDFLFLLPRLVVVVVVVVGDAVSGREGSRDVGEGRR